MSCHLLALIEVELNVSGRASPAAAGGKLRRRDAQPGPASTAAIATAVASTFDEFNPATHMRPERST